MTSECRLLLGDCLDILPTLADGSVDAVITDIPYGTTSCKWDEIIPLVPMWEQVKRVLRQHGVFVTTTCQPFTSVLVMSNIQWFRYEWIWDKGIGSTFQLANKMPLRAHESILIFSQDSHKYYPQMTLRNTPKDYRNSNYGNLGKSAGGMNHFASQDVSELSKIRTEKFPTSVLGYSSQSRETNNVNRIHPTQKPVALLEYLVRTYTAKDNTVLDFTMGSGTTGVACVQTGRNFIGIEIDEGYYKIAQKRIAEAQAQPPLIPHDEPVAEQSELFQGGES